MKGVEFFGEFVINDTPHLILANTPMNAQVGKILNTLDFSGTDLAFKRFNYVFEILAPVRLILFLLRSSYNIKQIYNKR